MPRWLALFFAAMALCAGLVTPCLSMAAVAPGSTAHQQTVGWEAAGAQPQVAENEGGAPKKPASPLSKFADSLVNDGPVELPELLDGPKPVSPLQANSIAPQSFASRPPLPPYLERPQRPPR